MTIDKKSRTPQGVRGLKFIHPSRYALGFRRTPQGVRGLKLMDDLQITISLSRTPQGVRGLKFYRFKQPRAADILSHPARGAWIEIVSQRASSVSGTVAPRKGCVD